MTLQVGVVSTLNNNDKLDNIIKNFKQQIYSNKKLFFIMSKRRFSVENIEEKLHQESIDFEIVAFEKSHNIGYNYNEVIEKMKEQNIRVFAIFDEYDIYNEKYLLEQVFYLNKNKDAIIGKSKVPMFIPDYNAFYTIDHFANNNCVSDNCQPTTILFYIHDNNRLFDTSFAKNTEKHFLDNQKIYVTSSDNFICVQNAQNEKHYLSLKQVIDSKQIYDYYSSFMNYKLIDISHLLVTIIITMFNSSKTIDKCLSSIINQTHQNIEIIVIDDNSTDNSIELVEKYMETHKNIRLIKNKENRGTYYCKNRGLTNLSKNTKYIAFQDSDDYSHNERIRKQVEILYFTKGKLSVTLCERYNVLRFACISQVYEICFDSISQVYDIEVFQKIGYFDNSRFGADSVYLQNVLENYENLKLTGNYNYENVLSQFSNRKNIFMIPHLCYVINNNDENCITNNIKLGSNVRKIYETLAYKKTVSNYTKLKSSVIRYIPIRYSEKYSFVPETNDIVITKDQFNIVNNIIINMEVVNINEEVKASVLINEEHLSFENVLSIYKENNKFYSYIFVDSPEKVSTINIIINDCKNIQKITLQNIDYIYYVNNINKNAIFNDFPYKDDSSSISEKQISKFSFLTLKYDKYYLNSNIKPPKKLTSKLFDLPTLNIDSVSVNPLVSIILTCYNAEKTIEMSIRSLLNQSYKNIEIIIIDDYSTDQSRNIINQFKTVENVKIFFNKQNIKTCSSRNVGLQYCSGEFITFQDGHDFSLYNRIEKQVSYSLANKCLINIGLCVKTESANNISLKETNGSVFDKIVNNIDTTLLTSKQKIPSAYLPQITLETSFIHKSVFEDIGSFALLPCLGDIEFIERFVCKKYKILFEEVTSKYNLITLLKEINNLGSIHMIKEVLYVTLHNVTSQYNKQFQSELKQKYRNGYKGIHDDLKRVKLSTNLFV